MARRETICTGLKSMQGNKIDSLEGLSEWLARLVAAERPRKPVDVAMLKSLTDAMPMQPSSAGDFVREMRDADRF